MCIKVQISYPRCSHVHLGFELCANIDPDCGYCLNIKTYPRRDPFCPLCSKLEYRAYRLQSRPKIRVPQYPKSTLQMEATIYPTPGQLSSQHEPQARRVCEFEVDTIAQKLSGPSSDGWVSEPFLLSKFPDLHTPIMPLAPVEPPMDPRTFVPHQLLIHWQKAAMAVLPSFGPRLAQQDFYGSNIG